MGKKIYKDDRIFVAGSNGMAGSAICNSLIAFGYGDKKFGGEILTVSRKELDLTNYDLVKNWFKINKPSVVIVAAAKVGGIYANSEQAAEFLLENIKIQTNIIENAWKNGVRKLLFLGSSCIYPKYSKQPIKEESLLTGSLEASNQWYAIAKISGIKLCEALRIQYGFDAVSLMPTNLYGPGDNFHSTKSHVLPGLIRRFYEAVKKSESSVTCWGTGDPRREFLHADDLGRACVYALEEWDIFSINAPLDDNNKPLNYLNVGSGEEISIKLLAQKIANEFQYKGDIIWDSSKPDGTPRKLLDSNRFNNLGWKPEIDLDLGIKKTVEYFKEGIDKGLLRI